MYFLLGFLIVIVVIVILNISQSSQRTKNIEQFENRLNTLKFTISRKITDIENKNTLYVNDKDKELTIYNAILNKSNTIKYDEILDFELIKDNQSVIKGRAGSTIVGGLLFGGIGAMIGASGSREMKETCNELYILININNLNRPNLKMYLLTNQTTTNSAYYKQSLEKAQEIISVLKYITEQNKNTQSVIDEENH